MMKRVLSFALIWIIFVFLYYITWKFTKLPYFTLSGWLQVLVSGGLILISIFIQKAHQFHLKTYLATITLRMLLSLIYLIGLALWLKKEAIIPILTYTISYFLFILIEALIHFSLITKNQSE